MRRDITFTILPLLMLGFAYSAEARVNTLTGGLDVSLDIDRKSNKNTSDAGTASTSNQNDDFNRLVTTPSLIFKSEDVTDSIELKYTPSFKYDLNGKGNDIDHNLNLLAQKSLIKDWQIKISELYVKSDDSTLTSNPAASAGQTNTGGVSNAGSDQISNELGRHRFWTNNSSLSSNYTYLQDSVVSLGYTYSVLRNDDTGTGGYQDYDKHNGNLSVSYRFLPEWKATIGGQYIRGLFGGQNLSTVGTQSDLTEYQGNMSLESSIFSKNTLYISYGYDGTVYDDPARNNSEINNATIGWKREISPHINTDLGGGPSYVKTEGQDGKWGYNAHANLNYAIEHGKFGLGVEKTYGQDNFSGTSTGGIIDSWTVKGDFNYRLFEDFSTGLFASYQDQDHQNAVVGTSSNTESYKEKIYSTGVTMKYSFWRWYSATVGYTFSRQDSSANSRLADFDEHRVYLTLGVQKELFRW